MTLRQAAQSPDGGGEGEDGYGEEDLTGRVRHDVRLVVSHQLFSRFPLPPSLSILHAV